MAAQSTYLANALLDWFGGAAYTPASDVYLGLFTTPLAPDGTGTEITGGSYAREVVSFGAAVDAESANDTAIEWTTVHTGSLQAVSAWGLFDASTGGNLLFFGMLSGTLIVPAGSGLSIDIGGLTIGRSVFGEGMSDYLAEGWLDHVLTGATFTPPTDIYLGMFTAQPDSTGAGFTEVTGGSYAREVQTFTRTADATTPGSAVTFSPLHTSTQTITGHGWFDASTTGNLLAFSPTYGAELGGDATLTVPASEDLTIAAGDLELSAA